MIHSCELGLLLQFLHSLCSSSVFQIHNCGSKTPQTALFPAVLTVVSTVLTVSLVLPATSSFRCIVGVVLVPNRYAVFDRSVGLIGSFSAENSGSCGSLLPYRLIGLSVIFIVQLSTLFHSIDLYISITAAVVAASGVTLPESVVLFLSRELSLYSCRVFSGTLYLVLEEHSLYL